MQFFSPFIDIGDLFSGTTNQMVFDEIEIICKSKQAIKYLIISTIIVESCFLFSLALFVYRCSNEVKNRHWLCDVCEINVIVYQLSRYRQKNCVNSFSIIVLFLQLSINRFNLLSNLNQVNYSVLILNNNQSWVKIKGIDLKSFAPKSTGIDIIFENIANHIVYNCFRYIPYF